MQEFEFPFAVERLSPIPISVVDDGKELQQGEYLSNFLKDSLKTIATCLGCTGLRIYH